MSWRMSRRRLKATASLLPEESAAMHTGVGHHETAYRAVETVDEVIARLDDLIAWSRREKQRVGYFACLYRNVTCEIKNGIAAGRFEDAERMERLDVAFANRYLEAVEYFRQGRQPVRCWQYSFRAASSWRPIVLQHLLLAMNAHIHLDLGVACALTCPGDQLPGLRRDFDEVNDILCAMVNDVQDRLGKIWPYMGLLDRVGCRTDEAIMNFSIGLSRVTAWNVAERLAALGPQERDLEIERIDRRAELMARLIRNPGITISLVNLLIRFRERGDIPSVIDVFSGIPSPTGEMNSQLNDD